MSLKLISGLLLALVALVSSSPVEAQSLPLVEKVEAQPLVAQAKRVVEALDYLGSPLPAATRSALEAAYLETDDARAAKAIQEALDPHCLFGIRTDPAASEKVLRGPAPPELVEQGWRTFLLKMYNETGRTNIPSAGSPNARAVANSPAADVENRWLDIQMFNRPPMTAGLSGLSLEYRIVQIYSRDAGTKRGQIWFSPPGLDFPIEVTFNALPTAGVTFRVTDENGRPTTASFLIRDRLERVYPSLTRRLAPDFSFHPQVYRSDGERVKLPHGEYQIEYGRGPEYLPKSRTVTLDGNTKEIAFSLERWIDPSRLGWWSGDHHIHAAGCSHYTQPTEGALPADMYRHCLGEDLKVGAALTWGPGFDYQKQFFTGAVHALSQLPYLLRYDVEVSGFGSHQSGHLCLLGLKEQIYPGGDSNRHWPTFGLNTLKWAKQQGAICGPAHSGWGLEVRNSELPNYVIPPFNGIGANEYIVDVTHELPGPDGKLVPAIDFLSAADTPYHFEMNIWYHTLNCGFRPRIAGETDFPCITDERVGAGRSYIKVDGELDYGRWLEGLQRGRSYVSDGRSHLLEMRVNEVALGENGSEVWLAESGTVRLTARVAALLPETGDPAIRRRRLDQQPYWHLERARVGETREVPVEVVVNGVPVGRHTLLADGTMRDIAFEVPIARSSWVALRIFASSHTNPVFVLVGEKPIRASRRSADWCLKSVDQCWGQKRRFIREAERDEAARAYDHARATYQKILAESEVE